MQKIKCSLVFLGFLLLLSCSGGSSFVLDKKIVDPFTVYNYPTLALPPVYYLSSQEIMDERRFMRQSREQVQSLLFNTKPTGNEFDKTSSFKKNSLTTNELALLKLAKADIDFYDIRDQIDKETIGVVRKQSSFIRKIFSNNNGEALDEKFSEYTQYNNK